MVHLKNGKTHRFSNSSGHFKPYKEMFDEVKRIFKEKLPKECFNKDFNAISKF